MILNTPDERVTRRYRSDRRLSRQRNPDGIMSEKASNTTRCEHQYGDQHCHAEPPSPRLRVANHFGGACSEPARRRIRNPTRCQCTRKVGSVLRRNSCNQLCVNLDRSSKSRSIYRVLHQSQTSLTQRNLFDKIVLGRERTYTRHDVHHFFEKSLTRRARFSSPRA